LESIVIAHPSLKLARIVLVVFVFVFVFVFVVVLVLVLVLDPTMSFSSNLHALARRVLI
jgi:hypothetical protein